MKRTTLASIVLGSATITAGVSAYFLRIRPWHLHWGATDAEVDRPLPGDDLVPNPRVTATHAITINAAAAEVWPWLVQMGQGRGGFYSYEWIEDRMGLDIRNESHIIPEFQNLRVGDTVSLTPDGFGPKVAALEPNRFLILHGDSRTDTQPDLRYTPRGGHIAVSWLFYLEEVAAGTTRLIERIHTDWRPAILGGLDKYLFWEPGTFAMERKMLLGIKQRAEATAAARDND